MMQVNELRVGNFIYSFNPTTMKHDHVLKIKVRNLEHIAKNPNSESYQPILLTPETISKCVSLKLVSNNEWWDCYQSQNGWHICYAKHNEPAAGVITGNFYYGDDFQQVEFIHDLQNLYFCTSFKKELEFIW